MSNGLGVVLTAAFSLVQYVTQKVEVESADSHKALVEMQTKNTALQEQLSVQRQLLRELETQLHESQRTCAQLRTQVTSSHLLHISTSTFCFLSQSLTNPDQSQSSRSASV